jgi:DNA modification methylase
MEVCNKLFCGDAIQLLQQFPKDCVNFCFTSPPYAEQRNGFYDGINTLDYPSWTLQWFNLVGSLLKPDGSIILNIREHEKNGVQDLYVLKTIILLCESGWKYNGHFIWYKPASPPLGSKKRLRRAFEDLYWFSKVEKPYINPKALGKIGSTGFTNKRLFEMGISCEHSEAKEGQVVRSTDVFSVSISKNKKGNPHPAQFPEELASQLIQIFCPPEGLVLDPFVGSGTTAIAAKINGRNYCGIDKQQGFIDYAISRINQTSF